MISTMIALAFAAQASDTTRASREAFTACLRTYVNQSVQGSTTLEAFRTAYPQQCTAQQQAFRDAVVRRETSMRATRGNAEQQASMEVDEARTNFAERFEMSLPETPAQPAQAAAQPAQPAQPAAQLASQPTPH